MRMAQGEAFYDNGFYNIGVTRTADDPGMGGVSPIMNPLTGEPFPLSLSRLALLKAQGLLPADVASFTPDLASTVESGDVENPKRINRKLRQLRRMVTREEALAERRSAKAAAKVAQLASRINDLMAMGKTGQAERLQRMLDHFRARTEQKEARKLKMRAERVFRLADRIGRVIAEGGFKTPTLRNVELTGPYFHNGGPATLRQVVDFYVRGGNFPVENIQDLAPAIREIPELQGNEQGKSDLVAFLLSLTDERVRQELAPFDHPQLFVPVVLPLRVTHP